MPKTASRTRKRHDLAHACGVQAAEEFNRKFPVGTPVWYWRTLPFGPVVETTVRGEAFAIADGFSNEGMPVCFLTGIAGYVLTAHVTEPKEEQRGTVQFYQPPATSH